MAKSSSSSHTDLSAYDRERPVHKQGGPAARVDTRTAVAIALAFAITVLILAPIPDIAEGQPGDRLSRDVVAPATIEVVNIEANTKAREHVRETHERIWTFRPNAVSRSAGNLAKAFEILNANRPETGSDIQRIADEIYEKAQVRLSNEDLDVLYKRANLAQLFDNLKLIASRLMGRRAIVNDAGFFSANLNLGQVKLYAVPPDHKAITEDRNPLGYPADVRSVVTESELRSYYPAGEDRPIAEVAAKILMQVISPNLEYDRAMTESNLDDLLKLVEHDPIRRIYIAGEEIGRKGQEINLTMAAAIAQANQLRRQAYFYRFIGVAVLTLLCFGAVGLYVSRLRGALTINASNITMMCLPVIFVLGAGRLIETGVTDPALRWVLFPAPLIGMLSVAMIGPQLAFILVLGAAVLYSASTGQSLSFFILALFGGFTSVLASQNIRRRSDVIAVGLRVGLVNMITVWLISLFSLPSQPDFLQMTLAFLTGLICGIVSWPLMDRFERAFGVVTDIGLLEITGPHHPLMQMLEERAPGTYQHVLNVTKLAESAAEAIGANFLLVRAGAYFHDVGKMLKPKFFSENQVTIDDKKAHSKLSPYMSTLIIKNHVKEGIELAKKHGLPAKVIDFIPQHHGTSLIRYFYNEALQRYQETESTDPVHEEDFRYPGPKPQSIEAAVVLLADSVEAIATSVFTQAQVNENDLRRTVERAIQERFTDGQFDECELTMRDLFLIRESFVKTLKARFHQRIAYPNMPRKDAPTSTNARETGTQSVPVSVSSGLG